MAEDEYLCETDYFRRLNLLCDRCGKALRGSYITALDRKFHVDHFGCDENGCNYIFGESDSYYEHDKKVYCQDHYAAKYADRCKACELPILGPYVGGKGYFMAGNSGDSKNPGVSMGEFSLWHPECYDVENVETQYMNNRWI